ncbi:MAG: (2Fe-2S)-binding protein [Deltaproteobacteria bacterium]|nr:(2Fe-2S)-binding protein [Deltaproteobacteria bacterium]
MVNITVDGIGLQANKEATVLQVARENGIDIPTLCYNESLGPEGRCRLCMVEVSKGNRTRIVTSCLYPVEEGLQVRTETEKVLLIRRMVLELLLARCPDSEVIQAMAVKMGVEKPRFQLDEGNWKCILCGLCVKTCEEAVGVSAIGLSQRGSHKKVGTPFLEPTMVCIGCGACHFICPTGAIKMTEQDGIRRIWGRDFKLQACHVCGNFFAPEYQLEWMSKKAGVPLEFFQTCQNCRK